MSNKFKVFLICPSIPNNRHYSFYPPISLGFIGTFLKERKNCSIKILDINPRYKKYELSDVFRITQEYKPNLIGITLTTPHVVSGYEIIKNLAQTKIPIVAGGHHPTFYPEEVLKMGASLVVKGEGELAALDVISYFMGEKRIEDVKGICYKSDGDIIHNASQSYIEDLDSLPIVDRSLFDYDAYIKNPEDVKSFGHMITSRSCPGRCTFCSKYDKDIKFRYNSAKRVYEEMKYLYETYGVNYFNFQDDAFTINKQRIKGLMSLIINDCKFSPRWRCMTRPDCIDFDLLKMMKEGGCAHISYGFESGDSETLRLIKKDVTVERMEEVVELTKQAGIRCQANFMVGFPWETKAHIRNTTKLINKLRPKVFRISNGGLLTPFPGTEIYEKYHQQYGFTNWWLNDKLPMWNNKENPPLFQDQRISNFMSFEQLLEINFFKHPKRIKREIRRFCMIAGRTEHNDYWHFPRLPVFLFFYYLSRFLYRISPKLERRITFPLFDCVKILIRRKEILSAVMVILFWNKMSPWCKQ